MGADERNDGMIVIADTTPLISLMKIGHLDLLHRLFGEVQIPNAVYEELVYNTRFPEESRQIQECSFINKIMVDNMEAVNLLRRSSGLDAGESEAIILSDNLNAGLLLMDEAKGRQVAKQMGIQIMGTIGMLLIAYKEHFLSKDEIFRCIDTLRATGRHISENLYRQLLSIIE